MHYRSKSSHYTPTAQDRELRRQAALGDHLCAQIDVWRKEQGLAAAVSRTNSSRGHKRGSDDDRRQIIADLISDDNSPFTPDDEEALRFMSDASLKEMRRKYVKANVVPSREELVNAFRVSADSDPVIKAMMPPVTDGNPVIKAVVGFSRDEDARRARADAYRAAHPVTPVTNASSIDADPAVRAMTEHSGDDVVANFLRRGK